MYKLYDTNYYKNLFIEKRKTCIKIMRKDKLNYINRVENSINTNNKYFFKYINDLNGNKNFPSSIYYNNEVADKDINIANLFAKKFGSVYKKLDLSNTEIPFDIVKNFNSLNITEDDIIEAINDLNLNISSGPDGISSKFIKECKYNLMYPLMKIFNFSLNSGCYPSTWKLSYVTPIYKNGDRSNVDNYRPISKMNLFPKIFDFIVHKKISFYFSSFVIKEQHGFLERRSILTNLGTYTHDISKALNEKRSVDSIYTDFSKAFDSVNTDLLLRKLHAYGICGSLLEWFKSYLNNRIQYVEINDSISEEILVLSGVGQGTHLGPLLFTVVVNDISHILKNSNILLFADDLKIYKKIFCYQDKNELQKEINLLYKWCLNNGLILNLDKCCFITFGNSRVLPLDYCINNLKLNKVSVIKDLGIYIDEELNFKSHINYIILKSKKKLNFLKRYTKDFTHAESFRTLYYSYYYPLLMFGSEIWNPVNNDLKKEIEKLNHLFLRYVSYKIGSSMRYYEHDYSRICELIKIPSLESARIRCGILFLFKIINYYIDYPGLLQETNFYVPSRNLRYRENYFYTPTIKDNILYRSIVNRISIEYNNNSNLFDLYNDSLGRICGLSKKLLVYK